MCNWKEKMYSTGQGTGTALFGDAASRHYFQSGLQVRQVWPFWSKQNLQYWLNTTSLQSPSRYAPNWSSSEKYTQDIAWGGPSRTIRMLLFGKTWFFLPNIEASGAVIMGRSISEHTPTTSVSSFQDGHLYGAYSPPSTTTIWAQHFRGVSWFLSLLCCHLLNTKVGWCQCRCPFILYSSSGGLRYKGCWIYCNMVCT